MNSVKSEQSKGGSVDRGKGTALSAQLICGSEGEPERIGGKHSGGSGVRVGHASSAGLVCVLDTTTAHTSPATGRMLLRAGFKI